MHFGVFPKWAEISVNSANSGNLINHRSMNCSQFKDPVSDMCLVGTVAACWSLTQQMASLSHFTVMMNIFVTEFSEFSEIFRKSSIDFVRFAEYSQFTEFASHLKKSPVTFSQNFLLIKDFQYISPPHNICSKCLIIHLFYIFRNIQNEKKLRDKN